MASVQRLSVVMRRGPRTAALLALLAALLVLPLALAPRADAFIYWSRGDGINRANLDGTGVDQMFIGGTGPSRDQFGDIAIDANYIYWAGREGIGRANLDGTDADPGFISGINTGSLPTYERIAVDAEHVYWSQYLCDYGPGGELQQCTGAIGRANLDGTEVDPAFIDGVTPVSVAVDADFIYWTNRTNYNRYEDAHDTIGRASLDGNGVNPNFITISVSVPPYGLATGGDLAVDANHLYWTEAWSPWSRPIARADLDGTNVDHDFVSQSYAYDLALDAENIYWNQQAAFGSRGNPSIGRANLDGSAANEFFVPEPSSTAIGIAIDGLIDTALAASASAAKTQKQRGKRIRVKVVVETREPLTAEASGKIEVNPGYKLAPKTVDFVESEPSGRPTDPDFINTAVQTKTLKLKPKRKPQAKKIARALKQGKKATAKLKVKLSDQAGNSATEKLRVRLKG